MRRPPPSRGQAPRLRRGPSSAGPLTNQLVAELAPQVLSRISWWRSLPRRSSHESLGGGACPAGPLTNQLVAGLPRRSSHESLGGAPGIPWWRSLPRRSSHESVGGGRQAPVFRGTSYKPTGSHRASYPVDHAPLLPRRCIACRLFDSS